MRVFLCILCIHLFSDISFEKYLPLSRQCFGFVDSFLHCAKILGLDIFQFVYFFILLPCQRNIQKILLWWMSSIIFPTFACRILMVPGLTSKYLIQFWVYGFVWCEKVVELDSLPCSCPIFPTPLPEKTVFSMLSTLASYVVGCSCKCGFISVPSLLFHKSCVCFVPVPHCFDYCIFVVEFEIRKHSISSFILLFQDYLAIGFFHDSMQILELLVLVLWYCSWDSREHGQQGDPTSPS